MYSLVGHLREPADCMGLVCVGSAIESELLVRQPQNCWPGLNKITKYNRASTAGEVANSLLSIIKYLLVVPVIVHMPCINPAEDLATQVCIYYKAGRILIWPSKLFNTGVHGLRMTCLGKLSYRLWQKKLC